MARPVRLSHSLFVQGIRQRDQDYKVGTQTVLHRWNVVVVAAVVVVVLVPTRGGPLSSICENVLDDGTNLIGC